MELQHGDVLIKTIKRLPAGVKSQQRENGRLVIMHGETTGHAHTITEKGATVWILEKDGVSQMYLEVMEPVTITHEEHKAIPIPPGIYEIGQVKEYDYFQAMERKVID